MTKLKLSTNKESVLNEIDDGKFNLDFDGYILHLKSFIPKEQCNQIVSSLKELEKDKSTPYTCLLYTSPSPRDLSTSRMPSSA